MRLSNISLLACLWIGTLVVLPAQAHKTEISGNVAGTWHLEPNHSAKAGEPARVWVALTQQGGQLIPLDQCDCTLSVYRVSQTGEAPIMQPTLTAMSPESFEDIPGAEITFPEVGEYSIVLTGSPRADATFSPFELSYTTVVAAGSTRPSIPPGQSETDQSSVPDTEQGSNRRPWKVALAVGGLGLAIAAAFRLRQQKPPRHKNGGLEP
ncbi:hypothetical protein IQ254_14905 [Nodosilinea sp. LEGE 07088]|uniref:hypothetical protein n=1 Tax=Nodosilinea sp. LEGE 07088 TaxID=2777968 RepID=UPI0018826C14|nr:hypothetical protein [Nodosilinea sp. LEGE 07088]MBE9138463.1 hypothetical protein [Nodosilinea sp. LEGE 07088]